LRIWLNVPWMGRETSAAVPRFPSGPGVDERRSHLAVEEGRKVVVGPRAVHGVAATEVWQPNCVWEEVGQPHSGDAMFQMSA
jgi:hypothetical protein